MNFKRLLKPILVILAILILTLSVSAGDLFSTYDQRIKLTIDHTKIDADLSWFPVTLFLGNYGDIDVGVEAIDRDYASFSKVTYINKSNPANASGKITSVEIYANSNMLGAIVATFYRPDPTGEPNYLVARDSYEIGSVTAGSKQTFEVDLDVEAGDYLGIYVPSDSGAIEFDMSGGDGRWYKAGNYTQTTGEIFTFNANYVFSLYATGFEKVQGTEVFSEFDADEDFDRIAFTSSDGETQLYADCELFDDSESKAIYHVSKTGWTVSSSADTDIYLYYDNTAGHNTTYISKSGDTAAQSVWDGSFEAVYHMNDTDVTYDTEYDGSVEPDSDGWTLGGTDYASSDGDILTIDTMAVGSYQCYYYQAPDVNFDNGVYIKMRVKVDSSMSPGDGFRTVFKDGTQDEAVYFTIEDGICYYYDGSNNVVKTFDTTTNYHIYEIYIKGTAVKFYIDGTLEYTDTVWSTSSDDLIRFGDDNATYKCYAYLDYLNYALDIGYNPAGIVDATSNHNDGDKKASGEPTEATGKVGKGQDFDGSDDYIDCDEIFDATGNFNVQVVFKADATTNIIYTKAKHGVNYTQHSLYFDSDYLKGIARKSTNDGYITCTSDNTLSTGTWYYASLNKDADYLYLYLDSTEHDKQAKNTGQPSNSSLIFIGAQNSDSSPPSVNHFNGLIDEYRISSTNRSAAWIGATYDSLYDTLLTYGSEETSGAVEEATNVLFIFSTL